MNPAVGRGWSQIPMCFCSKQKFHKAQGPCVCPHFHPPARSTSAVSAHAGISDADGRAPARPPRGSALALSWQFLAMGPPTVQRGEDREGMGPGRGGTLCTHFHQGFFDDSADVPPPLGDIRVVVIQVRREGQAKGSEFLWGCNSRVMTQRPLVFSKAC